MRLIGLLFGLGCAQLSLAQYFNLRSDYLNMGNPEIGWTVEHIDSGYVIFQNAFEDPSLRPQVGLTILSTNGTIISQHAFGHDSMDFFLGWMNTADRAWDNGYVLCGGRDSAQIDNALVWRFTPNGDSLWSTLLFPSSDTLSIGYAAKALPDSTILAVGALYPPGQEPQAFLAKLDQWGEVLWTREYGGSADERGRNIDVANDGSIYIGGETDGSPGPDLNDYLIKTDANGALLWSDVQGSTYNDGSAKVVAAIDGGVVYASNYTEYMLGSSEYTRHIIRRFDPSGSEVWERKYGPIRFVNRLHGIKALDDGSFIACGTYMGPVFPHGTLLKIAANGDSLWQREYTHPSTLGGTDWHELRDVIPTDDGGYVACGVVFDTVQDVWVIKVDSFGCLVPNCQLWDNIAEQSIDLNVLIYPNPTSDRLFISFRSAAPPKGSFRICDSAGREVRSFQPGGSSVEIDLDVHDLPSGLYVLRYEDGGGTIWKETLVIQ